MERDIVIFDLDGTLALIDHRRHLVEGKSRKKKKWREFFDGCVDDQPNQPVIAVSQALYAQGYQIIIFSGRSDEVERETKEWLELHGVKYHRLFMRRAGDYTPDQILKESWLAQLDRNRILCVFDDRQKVVDMWRARGIPCFQVAPGDF